MMYIYMMSRIRGASTAQSIPALIRDVDLWQENWLRTSCTHAKQQVSLIASGVIII